MALSRSLLKGIEAKVQLLISVKMLSRVEMKLL